jgi:hypothetical protein
MWWTVVIIVVLLCGLLLAAELTKKMVGSLVMTAGGVLSVIGLLLLSGQCTIWLKVGKWTSVSMAHALRVLEVPIPHLALRETPSVQNVIDWIGATFLSLPASFTLFVLGLLVFSFGKRRSKV